MTLLEAARERSHRWVRWLGGREPAVLISILIVVATSWCFIELADEVFEGDTNAFDKRMVRAMRTADDASVPIGPPFVQEIGRDVTALGGYGCLIFFTLTIAGYLWMDRKRHLAAFLLASAVSGYVLSTLLKHFFQRPRPDIVPHLSHIYNTTSFPSGHSMNAAVIYLTLGAIVAAAVSRRRLKVYVIGVALVITFLVGVSRIYLGVHYPTDVLAGWMAGLIWALLCWLTTRYLQRRGQVEEPPDESTVNREEGIIETTSAEDGESAGNKQ